MDPTTATATATASLAGLPAFLSYFGVAMALLVAFTFIYIHLTPHHEFALIKANKAAASLAFGGSLIGFCLPLHAAITNSVSLFDCAIWGGVALAIQLLVFSVLRALLPGLPDRISNNEVASGGFV